MPDTHTLKARELGYDIAGRALLRDIRLDLPAGQVSALLGPNGAGKTTLLRLLAGLAVPSHGAVRLAGQCVCRMDALQRARRIAWVPQHLPADIPLTVAEFAALGRMPYLGAFTRPSPQDRAAVAEALAIVEMGGYESKRLDMLSGGERQRVAIARALAQQAPVILLDEPTNHLDLRHQHKLQLLLRELAARGKTVVQVLHDLQLAAEYADRAALLEGGRLVAEGSPRAVLTPERLLEVYRWPVRLNHPAPDRQAA
ncbi:ABC transporter ATP-binding protein [Pseudogulbenkiania ferrooxidans]|uniref:ABC transporter ATP-binding protein n=1 Tax=Pseudogulbenkiania ferrooxidans EGD-HP2 TaxID=1388764 RepID=A0ABN0NBU7_9NEIS|nr:ABC transporter ATP-binding protein [Pseudogulbenkiania ferrooxidans]ERE20027.1 ABC transporter ATP-binding protein [Pseudogulbenkiania ferrooxidans EGD-HP2]